MITELILNLQDVPYTVRRSIVQDLQAAGQSLPRRVTIGVQNHVIRYYRPVYIVASPTSFDRQELSAEQLTRLYF